MTDSTLAGTMVDQLNEAIRAPLTIDDQQAVVGDGSAAHHAGRLPHRIARCRRVYGVRFGTYHRSRPRAGFER